MPVRDVKQMSLAEIRRRLDLLADLRLLEWGPPDEAEWARLATRERQLIASQRRAG